MNLRKKKLSLKRETLRKLDDQHLAQVAGGTLTYETIGSLDPNILLYFKRIGTTVSLNLACNTTP